LIVLKYWLEVHTLHFRTASSWPAIQKGQDLQWSSARAPKALQWQEVVKVVSAAQETTSMGKDFNLHS